MSRRFGFLVMSPERHSSSFPGKQKQVESLSAVWGLERPLWSAHTHWAHSPFSIFKRSPLPELGEGSALSCISLWWADLLQKQTGKGELFWMDVEKFHGKINI